MNKKIHLTIATRNLHKAQEIRQILPPEYEVHTLADYPEVPEVEETGHTFGENAAQKSCAVSAVVPGLVLADDSGLCVDVLGGYPGILSARYAGEHGNDAANNAKLLRELRYINQPPYHARFVCAVSVAQDGKEVASFLGRVNGCISMRPAGCGGFGYDPIFVPEGGSCTMAELSEVEKNSISHRANALQQFADWARLYVD